MRCLTYPWLQALMALVTAAVFFAAVYLGLRMKLRVLAGHVLWPSQRVFGIPDFRLYALADGIRQFLYSQTQRLKRHFELQGQPPNLAETLLSVEKMGGALINVGLTGGIDFVRLIRQYIPIA